MRKWLWLLQVPSTAILFAICGAANANGLGHCEGSSGYEQGSGSRSFLWRPEWLALEKHRVSNNPTVAMALRKAADAALTRGLHSVTAKTKTPQSGDKHDYYSIGPYWWPDPNSTDGLPYFRRDGATNPESRGPEFDKNRLSKFGGDLEILALATHHLAEPRYAVHAANLLRAWFLDPATRMNPNLNFAQAVPGINAGRGEGIIEFVVMSQVVESIGLVAASGALRAEEVDDLMMWFADFTDWMVSSANGREEAAKANNHGIYFDYLLTHFALFAGKEDLAEATANRFMSARIEKQMGADGSLPQELERTRSLHYSYFTLQAAIRMATVSECVGVDLWTSKSANGRSLGAGLSFLMGFKPDWKDWPHPESALTDANRNASLRRLAIEPLRMMAWGSSDPQYELYAQKLEGDNDGNYWLPAYRISGSAVK